MLTNNYTYTRRFSTNPIQPYCNPITIGIKHATIFSANSQNLGRQIDTIRAQMKPTIDKHAAVYGLPNPQAIAILLNIPKAVYSDPTIVLDFTLKSLPLTSSFNTCTSKPDAKTTATTFIKQNPGFH
jgi:hypothetical protein